MGQRLVLLHSSGLPPFFLAAFKPLSEATCLVPQSQLDLKMFRWRSLTKNPIAVIVGKPKGKNALDCK